MSVNRVVGSFWRLNITRLSSSCRSHSSAPSLNRVVSESYQRRVQHGPTSDQELTAIEKACASVIENRNPRNLEQLGLARKQLGWQLHHPRKDYWHKLNFVRTNRNTSANITHCSGTLVISASTNEAAIRRHLESSTDVSAASLVGAVLAQRCLATGITAVHFNADEYEEPAQSKRLSAFLEEFKDNGIALEEPPSRAHDVEDELLGVDYDKKETAELTQAREMAKQRAEMAEIASTMRQKAHAANGPVNFRVTADGRGVLSHSGETIWPKVPSAQEKAEAAEMERRRLSVYMVKPPNNERKPAPTRIVYAE